MTPCGGAGDKRKRDPADAATAASAPKLARGDSDAAAHAPPVVISFALPGAAAAAPAPPPPVTQLPAVPSMRDAATKRDASAAAAAAGGGGVGGAAAKSPKHAQSCVVTLPKHPNLPVRLTFVGGEALHMPTAMTVR